MKKIVSIILCFVIASIIFPFANIKAAGPVNVYIFHGDGCPHCAAAFEFFDSIEASYGSKFNLVDYEVWYSESNGALMDKVASHFGETPGGVPYIIVGNKTFSGYSETYDEEIKSAIDSEYKSTSRYTKVAEILGDKETSSSSDSSTLIVIAVIIVGVLGVVFYAKRNADVESVTPVKKKKN